MSIIRIRYLGACAPRLGSLGYMVCPAEIVKQSETLGVHFDYLVHCAGSSSTQSGLVAGFAAMGTEITVKDVADDETSIKRNRVTQLANDALAEIGLSVRVPRSDIEIIAADKSPYGAAGDDIFDTIRLLARTEGLVVDPVYEGKTIGGLLALIDDGRIESDCRILLMHLGGSPAVHAHASQFGTPIFQSSPS